MTLVLFGTPWADILGNQTGRDSINWTWKNETHQMAMHFVGYGEDQIKIEFQVLVNGNPITKRLMSGNFFSTVDLGVFEKGQTYSIVLDWKTIHGRWQGIAFFSFEFGDGNVPESPEDMKDPCVYANLAGALFENDRYYEVDRLLDIVLNRNPSCSKAWSARGNLQFYQKDSHQAKASFEKALELNPKETPALRGLGHLSVDNGQLDDAILMFRSVLAIPDAIVNDVIVSLIGITTIEIANDNLKQVRDEISKFKGARVVDGRIEKTIQAILLLLDEYEGLLPAIDRSDELLSPIFEVIGEYIKNFFAGGVAKSGSRKATQRIEHLQWCAELLSL